MSIWCSWPGVGHDDEDGAQRGEVRTYAAGWSNHFPTAAGDVELPASVDVAHVAPWCVPGHEQCRDCDGGHVGPWLRLTVFAEKALDHWSNPPTQRMFHESVVMDRTAVEALVADLNGWLALDHVGGS